MDGKHQGTTTCAGHSITPKPACRDRQIKGDLVLPQGRLANMNSNYRQNYEIAPKPEIRDLQVKDLSHARILTIETLEHCNLSMAGSLYLGGKSNSCFKWLQHGDPLRSPVGV